MNNLRIAITGAHSTGKTTLLEALRGVPELEGVDFLPEITRTIKEQGFNINEAGTLDTQVLIMASHMQNLLTRKRFIVDRSLIDGYTYTHYLFSERKDSIPAWFMDYCFMLLTAYVKMYDVIFYIPIEFPLVEDGVRSSDQIFRDKIAKLISDAISWLIEDGYNVKTVQGTVEQRVQTVRKALRELSKK